MEFKVVFVINSLGRGGSERSLAEMLPLFAEAGVAPVVVSLKHMEEGVQQEVVRQGIDVRILPGSALEQTRALRRILVAGRPALLHTTLFAANLIGRFAAVGTAVPVLTSLVNTSYAPVRLRDPNITPWKLRLVQAADALTAPLTDHFHAVTQAVKEAGVRDLRIAPRRITVVERGRDPEWLGRPSAERRRAVRARLGLGDEDEVLLNLGRQDYQKGQRYLLEAFERLASERPRLNLLVAGRPGGATGELERRLGRMAHADRVRFLGHRGDIADLLAAADVFVFSSLFEGIGGACIEAMALGLPVVCADLPGMREVVEDGESGLLVEPASAAALAEATGAILEDPERAAAMGQRGREIFERCFTLERSAERMVALFRHVADRRRTGAAMPAADADATRDRFQITTSGL